MNIFYKHIILVLGILLSCQMVSAQQAVSKEITKNFPITGKGELTIDTKYGDVVINGWEKDSIAIIVNIKVTHKKLDNAKGLLDRIQPKISVVGDLATVTSIIEAKKENFVSNYFSKSNPLDFDKTNVQIDYTIYLPLNVSLDITNKFGDIILENFNGRLLTNVEHGDMWINQNLTNATVNIKYGKLKTKSISYANITLKNAELDLENSQNLVINSSGSTINMVKVSVLEIDSNKDKIEAFNVGEIRGDLAFSAIKLDTLDNEINATMKVTDFKVLKINKPEAFVHIEQQSSDISINITGLSFKFKAVLEQGVVRIPKSFQQIKSFMIDKEKKLREISASYGESQLGKFTITGKKGNIVLIDNELD